MKLLSSILLTITLATNFSCSCKKDQVSVMIDGWGNDTVYVNYYTFSEEGGKDTLYARNGKFEYVLPVHKFTQINFYRKTDMYPRRGGDYLPSTRKIDLMVNPGEHLKVKGKVRADAVLEYTVSGSQLMEDISRVRKQTLPYEVQKDSNEFGLIAVMDRNAPPEEEVKFFTYRKELNAKIRAIERNYIRAYPDRLSSGCFILKQPLDSFPVFYAMLSDKIKTGNLKSLLDARKKRVKEYQMYMKNKEKEFVGQLSPDFTLTDVNGETFTFSEFNTQGKYILLDFWGSWCGPCLVGMTEMKKYYEKYRDKLEIIGIACRDKEINWKKTVSENRLSWIQLINDESSVENNVAVRYAVEAYPTKILLSPDKIFLLEFEGEGKDLYQKLDELLGK